MDFFDEIKRLCKIREMTIDELMVKIGKGGVPTYAGWRQRKCYPRANDFYKICQALEVPMEHFFTENIKILPPKYVNILKKIENLSDEDFKFFENLTEDQLKNLIALAKSMAC